MSLRRIARPLARSGLSAIAVLSPALDIMKHARAAMVRRLTSAPGEQYIGTQPNSIAPMGDEMDFLPETETAVPIIRGPGEGKVVGVLRDQSTFKVLSEETGGAYAVLEQTIPAGERPPPPRSPPQ